MTEENVVLTGDCVEVMATLEPDSIDAIVCDPPYLIGFMGKEWDGPAAFVERKSARRAGSFESAHGNHNPTDSADASRTRLSENRKAQDWHERWAREAFRIAKPGAHLLAFGGTRTYHRLASAIEDAGWEIRDCLVWGYASGFPKSLDVSKAIDKAAGAEREVVGHRTEGRYASGFSENAKRAQGGVAHEYSAGWVGDPTEVTAAVTPDAEKWQGWGTALKPAWEPIVMARKPLRGTVAANVLRHGTGALNIDGTRIGYVSEEDREQAAALQALRTKHPGGAPTYGGGKGMPPPTEVGVNSSGRWPANVVLTDAVFDGGIEGVVGGGDAGPAGVAVNRNREPGTMTSWMGTRAAPTGDDFGYGDSGTYSRFFLIPKSSRSDREPIEAAGRAARENTHPTVKPTDLMRHLVRLVTPPGGLVLDPFLGSGTTALAAEMEGFRWLGIELSPEYVAMAEARLAGTQKGLGLDTEAPSPRQSTAKGHWPTKRNPHKAEGWGFASGQDGLFEKTDG